MVIIDDSIFTVIRVRISPQALKDDNKSELFKFINEQNLGYKPFKLYFNKNADLMLESFLTFKGDETDGETIYIIFEVIINYLKDYYREFMKIIW